MKNNYENTNYTEIDDISDSDINFSDGVDEYNQYKNNYKNILWIDDIDNGDPGTDLDWLKGLGLTSDIYNTVEVVDSFVDAFDRITKHEYKSKYDLVVFDVDMNKGFEKPINEIKKEDIERKFKQNLIDDFKYSEDTEHNKVAGYYLFRLLFSSGYPFERMAFCSAHVSKDKDNDENELKYKDENIQRIIEAYDNKINIINKNDPKETNQKVEELFSLSKYEYYRVRRLVFQACEYWKEQLKNFNTDSDISFNQIYFKNSGDPISKSSFRDMLDSVEMMFLPVVPPNDLKKLYYLAMKEVAQFHEERADIKLIAPNSKNPNGEWYYPYHSMIRYFRNWNSHGKIEKSLNAKQFALLFCISLRTYFEINSNKPLKNLYYEEIWNFESDISSTIPSKDELISKLDSTWDSLISELFHTSKKKSHRNILDALKLDINGILNLIGLKDELSNSKYIDLKYMNLLLWFSDINLCDSDGSIYQSSAQTQASPFYLRMSKKTNTEIEKKVDAILQKLNDLIDKNNADYDPIKRIFMLYSYQLTQQSQVKGNQCSETS